MKGKLLTLLLLLMPRLSWAVADISKIEEGSNSMGEFLVNQLAGGLGMLVAIIGVIAAFAESKLTDSKWVIVMTIVITVGPFLLALLLKGLYL